MPNGPTQRVLSTGTAHVRLELAGTSARLELGGQVDEHSLGQLRELADHVAATGTVDDVRLHLAGISFGPGGVAALRAAVAAIGSRLRRAGAELSVLSTEPLPEAAVPDSLRREG